MMSNLQNPTIFGAIGNWWRNLTHQYFANAEINGFSDPDLSRIAQDVGLNASELRTLAGRWPASTGLLSERLAALGLDEGAIAREEPAVLRDLQRVCGDCAAEGRCAHDLNRDEKDRVWRDYCPNVETLDALRTEERDRRLMRRRKWHELKPAQPPSC
jgi:hypothetical protein